MSVSEVAGGGVPAVTAGIKSIVVLLAKDSEGNRLATGGGSITAHTLAGGERTEATVFDSNNGTYQVGFAVNKAGPYTLVLESGGTKSQYEGECLAGPSAPAAARSDPKKTALATAAGEPGWITLQRADAFGNILEAYAGDQPFLARADGPGPAEVTAVEGSAGQCKVWYEARTAGRYEISVWDASTGEAIPESPFAVEVLPGAPSTSTSVAEIESINASMGVATVGAGAIITVRIESKDRFGNPSPQPPGAVAVRAAGRDPVKFLGMSRALGEDEKKSVFLLTGNFHSTGDYDLTAIVPGEGGVGEESLPLRGASRIVVVPGRVHVPSAAVSELPRLVAPGQAFEVRVSTPDQYGNLGGTGGVVSAFLAFYGEEGGWKQVGDDIPCETTLLASGEHLVRPITSVPGSYKLVIQLMSGLSRAVKLAEETFTVETPLGM